MADLRPGVVIQLSIVLINKRNRPVKIIINSIKIK